MKQSSGRQKANKRPKLLKYFGKERNVIVDKSTYKTKLIKSPIGLLMLYIRMNKFIMSVNYGK